MEDTEQLRVLEFGASWCGQCRALQPMLTEECKRLGVQLEVIDCDEHDEMAQRFRVRGLPTVVVMKGSERLGTFHGIGAWKEIAAAVEGVGGQNLSGPSEK